MVTAMLLLFTVCVSQFYITSCSPEQESLEEFLSLLKSESLALSPIGKQVAEDLENDDDVQLHAEDELCKITQMHGFQDRQGILPFENNQKKYQNKISNFLDRWHEKRHQNKAYVPPVLQRSCHPIISHKYKFIYFGMPKTASRTTSAYFENIACNGTKEEDCFLRVYDAKTLKKEEYLKYYDEYFKFAFIRNPYARAASVYFMIAQGEKNGQHFYMRTDDGEKCAPPFHQHCLDPYKLKELCGKHYKGIQTNNTMGDCCCHLKEEWIEQSFLDQHFMPQAPCIFDHEGKITVDFIGGSGTSHLPMNEKYYDAFYMTGFLNKVEFLQNSLLITVKLKISIKLNLKLNVLNP
eukprot:TRINITY_DN8589_c0_g1_i4.p1 TRINITY_DN8589_c0_g1~~TRINITY_DN8589_c0_g1_i4.p1  ORF type:complete len:361 (-),score=28.56 TRINITY_DN8589_c0_g1_i4:1667-2719(-)